MQLTDIFSARAIAANYTNEASNNIEYIGAGFFPAQKKAGLDLKWILGHNGLPVSLMPSNFDAKATLRDRVGVSLAETQMAFFREAMLIKEKDRQEIMRVQDSADPYAAQVLANIFNDANTLIDGATVVQERMRMQLLAPLGGSVGIQIKANNVDYTYNYDPSGTWAADHYSAITATADKWTASATSDPISDIEKMLDAQETAAGNRPEILLMSKKTFGYIKNADKVHSYILAQNSTANIFLTDALVRAYLEDLLGVTIVVYTKKYKDEAGTAHNFYPDDIVFACPNGALGKTWFGTTPEEADLLGGNTDADVSIVDTGVAVTTIIKPHPVNIETIVSEIVLPSFERLNECCAIEVA